MVQNVKTDLRGAKERILDVFEGEDLALNYTRRTGVYNCDQRSKDLFHSSVSQRAVRSWRKSLT